MHRERMEQQHRGEATYLVAWLGRRPVGFVLLRHRGIAGYPEAHDLCVAEASRGHRYGSGLMEAAEHEASAQGASRLGLEVDLDNNDARSFYEKRGYIDAQTPVEVQAHRTYLRKDLGAPIDHCERKGDAERG